jgi:hypothetical protein
VSSPRESDLRTAEAATWSAKKGASFTRAAETRPGCGARCWRKAHEAFVRVAGDHPKSPEKIYLDLASRREPDSKRRGCFKSIGGLPSMARPTSMKSSPATRNHLPNRRISLPLPTTWKDRH